MRLGEVHITLRTLYLNCLACALIYLCLEKLTLSDMSSALWAKLNQVIADAKPPRPGGLGDMLRWNWHLGLTSFGGPAVHFQIVRFPQYK